MGPDSKAPRSFTKRLMSPTICVCLPTIGEEFHIHRQHLQDKSVYFASLQSSGLREASENKVTIQLNAGASRAFRAVAEYIYTDTYQPHGENQHEQCIEAAYVYVLADRFLMMDLESLALINLQKVIQSSDAPVNEERIRDTDNLCDPPPRVKKKKYRDPGVSLGEEPALHEVATNPLDPGMLALDNIATMKAILYDGAINVEDDSTGTSEGGWQQSTNQGDVCSATPKTSVSPVPPVAASHRSEESSTGSSKDQWRAAQLEYIKFLSKHLDTLRASPDFREFLLDGSLDGLFTVDLLCSLA